MAMIVEKLRLLSTGYYRLVVLLDDTVSVHDERRFYATLDPLPDGISEGDYLDSELLRLTPYCEAQLEDLNATEGSALPQEGDPL